MTDKEVYIGGKRLGYCTSVKASPETNTETTTTFDGVVGAGTRNIGYTIDIESLRYGELATYREMIETLDSMLDTPKEIVIRETVRTNKEVWTLEYYYFDCILDSMEYEISADARTVNSLSFKATGTERKFV